MKTLLIIAVSFLLLGAASPTATPTPAWFAKGGMAVAPLWPTIKVGNTQQLNVTGAPGAVVWSSSNPPVATVSADGLVTGVAPGVAVIQASSGKEFGWSTVQVNK